MPSFWTTVGGGPVLGTKSVKWDHMIDENDLVERLGDHVIPLVTATPGTGPNDLRPLAEPLGDARIVGLGEATHGTKEFFQLKHRLIRYLVTELDFRLFGIEASFAEVFAIDKHVVSGHGDPAEALDSVNRWTINTQEMLSLVNWLREYNEGRPTSQKVRVYGYDSQFPAGSAAAVRAFIEQVDSNYVNHLGDDLQTLEDGIPKGDADAMAEWLIAAETVAIKLADLFERDATKYETATSERAFELACRHRRIIEQAAELIAARLFEDEGVPNGVRDSSMAENVTWILATEDTDRIALWAHNGHVKTGAFKEGERDVSPKTMGGHLREAFGYDYYAIGFEFGHGSFQAYPNPDRVDELVLESFSLESIREDSIAAVLDRVADERYFLDIASVRDDPLLREWVEQEQQLHNIGSVYPDDAGAVYVPVDVADDFDGLVFVTETNRAVSASGR